MGVTFSQFLPQTLSCQVYLEFLINFDFIRLNNILIIKKMESDGEDN